MFCFKDQLYIYLTGVGLGPNWTRLTMNGTNYQLFWSNLCPIWHAWFLDKTGMTDLSTIWGSTLHQCVHIYDILISIVSTFWLIDQKYKCILEIDLESKICHIWCKLAPLVYKSVIPGRKRLWHGYGHISIFALNCHLLTCSHWAVVCKMWELITQIMGKENVIVQTRSNICFVQTHLDWICLLCPVLTEE